MNHQFKYKLKYNHVVITGINADVENLVIPSRIDGYPVETIDKDAFFCSRLRSVVLSEGLKNICAGAFSNCYNLRDVTFPSTLYDIHHDAFHSCHNLESITLNEGLIFIGNGAFENCNIQEIMFPNSLNRVGVEAFAGNPIHKITFGSNMTEIGDSAFFGCDHFEDVVLPDSLRCLGNGVFDYCENLKHIHIGKNLTQIDGVLGYLSPNLCEITVSPQNNKFKIFDGVLYDVNNKTLLRVPPMGEKSITIPSWVEQFKEVSFSGAKLIEQLKIRPTSIIGLRDADIRSYDLVVHCEPGSDVEKWAKESGFNVISVMSQMERFFENNEIKIPTISQYEDCIL